MKSLNIWLVKYGEVIPFLHKDKGMHYFRSGEVTRRLIARGHVVTWWTGRFQHQTKSHLNLKEGAYQIDQNGSSVFLIDSPGYARNVSARRFYDHYVFSRKFRRLIEAAPAPDAIVTALPVPELALQSVNYGKRHNVPVAIDVRDMWPDTIARRLDLHSGLPIGRFLTWPYESIVRKSLSGATSVFSVTSGILKWAQNKAGRTRAQRECDEVYHLAANRLVLTDEQQSRFAEKWRERGFEAASDKIKFVWAGSMTNQAATREFLAALDLLDDQTREAVSIVICGRGDLEAEVAAIAERNSCVIFTGFIPRDELQYLYDSCNYGLLTYDREESFLYSFPNKFAEYLMSGLSIITTITGHIEESYGDRSFIIKAEPERHTIVNTIKKLSNSDINPAASIEAQTAFRDSFDSDVVYEQYCDHIERMAAAQPPQYGENNECD